MELVLEVINPHELKEGCARSWVFHQAGGIIGRGADCHWHLEDLKRHVSRHHARIGHENGAFHMIDISRNGTVLNGAETIRSGERRLIREGDLCQLAGIKVRARLINNRTADTPRQDRASNVGPPMPNDGGELDPLLAMHGGDRSYRVVDELSLFFEAQDPGEAPVVHPRIDREQLRLPELVAAPVSALEQGRCAMQGEDGEVFWRRFAEALGVDLSTVDSASRQALAIDVAGLFKRCLDGLEQNAWTQNEVRRELKAAADDGGYEPASSLPVAGTAPIIQQLLHRQPERAARAITRSFRDLQTHQLALLAGCRAMARATLTCFSPQQLHWHFEQQRKPLLRTAGSRWRAYARHHRELAQDDSWCTDFVARDFTPAYDEQTRLINTLYPN